MPRVTLSSYSRDDGEREHCVLVGGAAHTRPTRYLHHHAAVARDLARRNGWPLARWDGDRPWLGEVELSPLSVLDEEGEDL